MQREIWDNNENWIMINKRIRVNNNGNAEKWIKNRWKPIGTKDVNYKRIWINGKLEYLHREIYKAFHGEIPKGKIIDHIIDKGKSNKANNLQAITFKENLRKDKNPKSGYNNVYKNGNKWRIQIINKIWNNKLKHFGNYDTPEKANIYAKLIQEIIKKTEEEIKEIINLIIKENEKYNTIGD